MDENANNRQLPRKPIWFNNRKIQHRFCSADHSFIEKKGQSSGSDTFSKVDFAPLYVNSRPINKKKYDDLQKLLEFIPSEYHWFFTSLTYEDDIPNATTDMDN